MWNDAHNNISQAISDIDNNKFSSAAVVLDSHMQVHFQTVREFLGVTDANKYIVNYAREIELAYKATVALARGRVRSEEIEKEKTRALSNLTAARGNLLRAEQIIQAEAQKLKDAA